MNAADSWHIFDEYQLHRVVLALVARRCDGVLTAKNNGFLRRLFFRKGGFVFATSDNPDERLPAALARRGVLSREQYSQARKHFSSSLSIGRNLVELGLVSEAELRESARAQVFAILVSLMGAKKGHWCVSTRIPKVAQIPMTMPHVFIRALLEWEDREWIGTLFQDRFAKEMHIPISAYVARWAAEVDGLGAYLCAEIEKRVTLRELVYERDLEPFFILRWIYILDLLGRSFLDDPGAGTTQENPEPPPVRRKG